MRDIELPLIEHAACGGEVEQQVSAGALHCRASRVAVGIQGMARPVIRVFIAVSEESP
jgi:hypothetical protein